MRRSIMYTLLALSFLFGGSLVGSVVWAGAQTGGGGGGGGVWSVRVQIWPATVSTVSSGTGCLVCNVIGLSLSNKSFLTMDHNPVFRKIMLGRTNFFRR